MTHSEQLSASSGGKDDDVYRLFALVDTDKDGQLGFKEVAGLFKRLAPEQSTRSARNAAVEALLLTDSNVDRKLNHTEFQELLSKIAGLAGIPVATAADSLLAALQADAANTDTSSSATDNEPVKASTTHPAAAAAAAAEAAAGLDGTDPNSTTSQQAHSNSTEKLQRLFRLWDRAGDGSITFNELCQGLAKFKPITGKQDVTSLLTEVASILSSHDSDGDRRLQFDEFTAFITKFMGAAGYKLEEVLDELITLAHRHDSRKLQAVLDSAQPQIDKLLSPAKH